MNTVLITGGAGFIGSNLAQRLLTQTTARVCVFDNLSRQGVSRNVEWLRKHSGSRLKLIEGDVRDYAAVRSAISEADEIFHLAAQVAVTSSVLDPSSDFNVNAVGTFHVLEAARLCGRNPFLLFTSTNKVYGSLGSVSTIVEGTRYRATRPDFNGVTEDEPLDFHSPYGCSKGAADQYVRDYARIFDLDTVVFRMSCIAGPRQFGNEDQGWVAHFLYSILEQRLITICGDGFQIRDILHVHDLVDAMMAARDARRRTRGEVYNLGGGISRALSVIELLRECERRTGFPLHLHYADVRPGDQPLYISDTSKFEAHTGWRAHRSLDDILNSIEHFWLDQHQQVLLQPSQLVTKATPAAELAREIA